jgi:hypothetical protein
MTGNVNVPRQLSLSGRCHPQAGREDHGGRQRRRDPPEKLTQILVHGFTIHTFEHGFGLHGSALAARETGGGSSVHSDGAGRGAEFTLKFHWTASWSRHEAR